jgi:hypothetical protein
VCMLSLKNVSIREACFVLESFKWSCFQFFKHLSDNMVVTIIPNIHLFLYLCTFAGSPTHPNSNSSQVRSLLADAALCDCFPFFLFFFFGWLLLIDISLCLGNTSMFKKCSSHQCAYTYTRTLTHSILKYLAHEIIQRRNWDHFVLMPLSCFQPNNLFVSNNLFFWTNSLYPHIWYTSKNSLKHNWNLDLGSELGQFPAFAPLPEEFWHLVGSLEIKWAFCFTSGGD